MFKRRRKKTHICPQCGHEYEARDSLCPQCSWNISATLFDQEESVAVSEENDLLTALLGEVEDSEYDESPKVHWSIQDLVHDEIELEVAPYDLESDEIVVSGSAPVFASHKSSHEVEVDVDEENLSDVLGDYVAPEPFVEESIESESPVTYQTPSPPPLPLITCRVHLC